MRRARAFTRSYFQHGRRTSFTKRHGAGSCCNQEPTEHLIGLGTKMFRCQCSHPAIRTVPMLLSARFCRSPTFRVVQARLRMSPGHCCISCRCWPAACDVSLIEMARRLGQAKAEAMQSYLGIDTRCFECDVGKRLAGNHLRSAQWPSFCSVLRIPALTNPRQSHRKTAHLRSAPSHFVGL